jgi:colanic acid/amylovoran biosynthesis protein
MAQRLGKPTAMFGQGIGPITHPLLTRLAPRIMPRLLVIGLREGLGSGPALDACGVNRDRVEVTGDDALLLATKKDRPATGAAIGLNIRVAFYSEVDKTVAERAVAITTEWARTRRVTLCALPVSRNKAESDLEAIRRTHRIGQSGDVMDHDFADIRTPGELVERTANCRVVVTGSYHAAVFALAAGIPAVCLTNSRYYDSKFQGLAAQFPGGCQIVHPGPLFESKLRGAIDESWKMDETERDRLHSAAVAQVEKADHIYARFKSVVTSTVGQPTK